MPTGKMVTGFDFSARVVTIDVPHGDLLTALATALAEWESKARHLDASMAVLRGGPGVFLDPDGKPVIPGWWERKANGRHVAWYLVWPHKHARKTGCKRRQYVRTAEVEETRVKVARTLEYANFAARREKVAGQMEQVGRALGGIVEKFEMVTTPARRRDDLGTTGEMVPKLAALGTETVTTQPDAPMVPKTARLAGAPVTTGGQGPGSQRP